MILISYISCITNEQKEIFHKIIDVVKAPKGGMFFLYGYGGIDKTFMWKTLASALRSQHEIVLTVTSSGIASLVLPGGRTTHSKFLFQLLIPLFVIFTKGVNLWSY